MVQAYLQAVEASPQADRGTGRSRWHRASAIRCRCASGSQGLDLPSAPPVGTGPRGSRYGVRESPSPSNKLEGIEPLSTRSVSATASIRRAAGLVRIDRSELLL